MEKNKWYISNSSVANSKFIAFERKLIELDNSRNVCFPMIDIDIEVYNNNFPTFYITARRCVAKNDGEIRDTMTRTCTILTREIFTLLSRITMILLERRDVDVSDGTLGKGNVKYKLSYMRISEKLDDHKTLEGRVHVKIKKID